MGHIVVTGVCQAVEAHRTHVTRRLAWRHTVSWIYLNLQRFLFLWVSFESNFTLDEDYNSMFSIHARNMTLQTKQKLSISWF